MSKVKKLFLAQIKDGKVVFDDTESIKHLLKDLNGESVRVKIERFKTTRTLNQNNYYWAYLRIISNDTGELPYDLHELFKQKLLFPDFKRVLGREVLIPPTTTNKDTAEFTDYINDIENMTGVPAPDPDELYI